MILLTRLEVSIVDQKGFKIMSANLIFIGAPGSGKGTQSKRLTQENGYKHISTGDLLRSEIEKGSELGNRVKSVMDSGNLVSDDLVIELIKANINLDSEKYIFDGYPRNLAQAETLTKSILHDHKFSAIYFSLDTNKLVERLTNRRVSQDGKYIYNLITNPPKVDGICDVTGLPLMHRADDNEETIRNRMKVFAESWSLF